MIKFYLFIIFVLSIFLCGIAVGHYEIFPFDLIQNSKSLILNNFEKEQNNILIYEENIDSLILINSENDVIDKRKTLTNFIWNDQVPYSSTILVDENIVDERYQNLSNLKSIHRLTISMEYSVNSISYLFLPENSNDQLIIYHQGHRGDFINGKDTIDFFLDKNYSVLAFSMPLLGMNNQPIIDLDHFGKIKFTNHKQLQFLESSEFSPVKFFIEPIGVSLNYLNKNFDFDSYYMMGISGGGWTTVLFSAIDDRISQSYSVAGTIPIFMRSDSKNIGDYEQIIPELYAITNYLELYILNSYGDDRIHVQISNNNDPCCFSGNISGIYDHKINERLIKLDKGNFFLYTDYTHNEHKISEYSRILISEHMDNKILEK
ncbi:MAG: hypothetical protein CXT78_01330 [Thaumarchaeota archaeon]|jgi:hypothetical protein|nr:MAG: hypothetical protein CXT78_01330 [Nitrososphaerota archaeon]